MRPVRVVTTCLSGRVRALRDEGPLVRTELDCGFTLFASMTRQAAGDLDLTLGQQVVAAVKTPAVHLIVRKRHATGG